MILYVFRAPGYNSPISDLVNRDISTAGGRASLYNWIVYKQEYKARERKGEEQQRYSTFYAILESRKLI